MLLLYNFVAMIVFYLGLYLWLEGESGYVRLPAIICSVLAFQYVVGMFPWG